MDVLCTHTNSTLHFEFSGGEPSCGSVVVWFDKLTGVLFMYQILKNICDACIVVFIFIKWHFDSPFVSPQISLNVPTKTSPITIRIHTTTLSHLIDSTVFV